MERKLYIIRHGKSSWNNEGLDDIDRPLNERGTRSAVIMAKRLMEKGLVPGLIYSSPANRALSTAEIMKRTWGLDPSALHIYDELYMAYESEITGVVEQAPDEAESLAIFGHNPSFTHYANTFLDNPLDNLPTAGVVVISIECDSWRKIGRKHVRHTYVDIPKR